MLREFVFNFLESLAVIRKKINLSMSVERFLNLQIIYKTATLKKICVLGRILSHKLRIQLKIADTAWQRIW